MDRSDSVVYDDMIRIVADSKKQHFYDISKLTHFQHFLVIFSLQVSNHYYIMLAKG